MKKRVSKKFTSGTMFAIMWTAIYSWIVRLYFYIFDRIILYPLMQLLPTKNVKFMNLGYAPRSFGFNTYNHSKKAEDEKIKGIMDEMIETSDSVRAHCYLYEKALSMCPIYPYFHQYTTVEIGAGLGGGVEWMKRAHTEMVKVIGIDKVVAADNTDIIQGDAEKLPLESESVDLMINIESSHLYSDIKAFFEEVHRVLRPGGYFCWADLRYKKDMPAALEQAKTANLHLLSYENITAEVLNGIEFTSRHYDKLLNNAPWFVRLFKKSIRTTYCAPGTHTYNRFAKREKIYAAACWCKEDPNKPLPKDSEWTDGLKNISNRKKRFQRSFTFAN